jgi:hypothetical protein
VSTRWLELPLARLAGWLRWLRHRAFVGRAAGGPVELAITALCLRADEEGLASLSARQADVVLAWSARGIIGNGGFRAYSQGSGDMKDVVRAFRGLGFEEAASACERSMSMFPLGLPPEDPGRRAAACAAIDWEELRAAERSIYAVSWDALTQAIGACMRRLPGEFPELR